MNLSLGPGSDLLYMGFNQTADCIAVGTKSGFRIFNCEPFGRNVFAMDGGIGTVQMLFCTSLVALVGAGDQPAFSPRRLKLWNTKTASAICELNFPTAVLAVKMNHKRLVVAIESKIHIYDLQTMANLQTLETTTLGATREGHGFNSSYFSTSSVCALSPDDKNCFLALPANSTTGDVLLYDALNLIEFNIIHAHRTALTALAFSMNGKMLATASETGTVIRVFAVPSQEKLYVFRRGSYSAVVYSMSFDEKGSMLAVSSSTGTIHVFNLNLDAMDSAKATGSGEGGGVDDGMMETSDPGAGKSSFLSFASGALDAALGRGKVVADMLPGNLSDMVEPSRSFAHAKLRNKKVVSVCALSEGYLRVVTSEGRFYQYAIQRGECQLVFEMVLTSKDGESEGEGYTSFFKYQEEVSSS